MSNKTEQDIADIHAYLCDTAKSGLIVEHYRWLYEKFVEPPCGQYRSYDEMYKLAEIAKMVALAVAEIFEEAQKNPLTHKPVHVKK